MDMAFRRNSVGTNPHKLKPQLPLSYALETQLVRYEGNEVNRVNDLFEKVILSLRLFKSGEVDQKVTFFKREEGRGARAFWRLKKTSMTPRPYNLTTNEISKFVALLNKVISIDLNKRRDLNISIHRFSKTYDDSLEEKFIDLMIAMESLVLFKGKGEGRSNIKEKIAVGVSMLIGKNFKEGERAYEIRNDIVHGIKHPMGRDEEKLYYKVEDYLRRAMVEMMD